MKKYLKLCTKMELEEKARELTVKIKYLTKQTNMIAMIAMIANALCSLRNGLQ